MMGATEEECVTVAGFAGGIGLSGNGCGALSAVIWYKMLRFIQQNPDKKLIVIHNPEVEEILKAFYIQTDAEMECHVISERKFNSMEEHTEYVMNGGCGELLKVLSEV